LGYCTWITIKAGQELFRAVVRSFYKGISAVFFVYAIDRATSFEELKAWSQ
jgi:GTPase SAR1 family protein